MKPVIYRAQDWPTVRKWMVQEFGLSACSNCHKQVFGFNIRFHEEWVKDPNYAPPSAKQLAASEKFDHTDINQLLDFDRYQPKGWYEGKIKEHTVRLDFDNEDDKTMWVLRSPVAPKEL